MISILIVDDNAEKLNKISNIISSPNDVNSIDTARNLNEAYNKIQTNLYDVVILDICIPKRDGEPAKMNGGIEFLEAIEDNIIHAKIPCHIIGLTAFDETYNQSVDLFKQKSWNIIKYDPASTLWINEIQSFLKHIKQNIYSKKEETNEYDYDIGIVCALHQVELEKIKKLFDKPKIITFNNDSTRYHIWKLSNAEKHINIVAAALPQMGMLPAAVTTTNMMKHFKPRYVTMTGICAGISEKTSLGDVLVIDPSWDYGYGKFIHTSHKKKFESNPMQLRMDKEIAEWFRCFSENKTALSDIYNSYQGKRPDTHLRIHIGPVASGDAVIADSNIIDRIKQQNRKVLGVEMEAYGVFYAGDYGAAPKPKVFVIKSVSDFANSGKNDDFQDYAAYTSAKVLEYFIKEYLLK